MTYIEGLNCFARLRLGERCIAPFPFKKGFMKAQLLAITACALSSVGGAYASSFAVNELAARAQGMGGAFTSIADDPSAIFFNPAGLTQVKGMQISLDNLIVAGQFRFVPSITPPGAAVPEKGFSGATSQPFIPVASFYLSKQINDRFTAGFGVYTPFGLAANFTNFNDGDPANTKYVGRFSGTRARLEQYWFQPTVGIKLSESHSIGIGIAAVHTHLFLEQSFLNPLDKPDDFGRGLAKAVFPGVDPDLAFRSFSRLLPEGRLRAAATSTNVGFTTGYLFKHKSGVNLGVMMRTKQVNHMKGRAAFSFTQGGTIRPFLPKDQTLELLFPNQDISTTFTTPATYVVGVSKTGFFGGTFGFDVRIQDFRTFRDLPINFSQNVDSKGRELATPPERRLVFDFRNSYLIQTGFEKPLDPEGMGKGMMKKLTNNTTVRAGYVFDYSPTVEKSVGPLFPDATRHSWTAGMTKRRGRAEFTMFYQWMQFLNRTTNVTANDNVFTNGEYRNFAHLGGLGLKMYVGKQPQ